MASNKKYWKSVEELDENSTIVEALQQNEFVTDIPTDEFLGDKETLEASSTTRRDFLKYVGFTTAASKSVQETSLPASCGTFNLLLSYNDNTEACTLAFTLPLWADKSFRSILIGRPSRVLTSTFAKSKPSAMVLA